MTRSPRQSLLDASDGRARDPDRLDDGPPADPTSPFAETTAAASRESSLGPAQPRRGLLRALFSWLIVIALVGGAVFVGLLLVDHRREQQDELHLGTATLQVTTVAVPAPGDGQVLRVFVEPSERVERGDRLAQVRLFATGPDARLTTSTATISAPLAGVVAEIVAPSGSAVQSGGPVVGMYEPGSASFQAPVEPETLARLRRGMRATLTSPGSAGAIPAVVDRVLPADTTAPVENGAETAATPTLVLRPERGALPRGLVPGLQFDATVDVSTAADDAPSLLPLEP